jgi:protein-tyrosine phosphatase
MTESGILFVCMANICRSPTAEGVFRAHAARAGIISQLRIDSAGTHDFFTGEPPDWRATQFALKRGYDIAPLRARHFGVADFSRFDRIYAMDLMNLRVLEGLRPREYRGDLGLFLDVAPVLGVREVPDPYDGGPEGFERVLDLVEQASAALVKKLVGELR